MDGGGGGGAGAGADAGPDVGIATAAANTASREGTGSAADGVGVLPSSHAVEPHLHEVCKQSLSKVRKIAADNGAVFFEEPVNVEEYKDYPSIVKQPMCLKMVEVRHCIEGEGSLGLARPPP